MAVLTKVVMSSDQMQKHCSSGSLCVIFSERLVWLRHRQNLDRTGRDRITDRITDQITDRITDWIADQITDRITEKNVLKKKNQIIYKIMINKK